MTKHLIILALSLGFAKCPSSAQDGQRPPPPEGGAGGAHLHLLPRGTEETLNLTADQRRQVTDLEVELKTKLEIILTPDQMEKLKAMRPPQPPGGQAIRGQRPPAPDGNSETARAPAGKANGAGAKLLPAGVTRVPVVFSGGHETDPIDHGRPVVLIAAALGVKPEVFREAFSHVHPAGPGGGPTDAEARQNKTALMNALGKFGITNERLDAVSNFYRYPPGRGGVWKNQTATANALVKNGAVISYEITSGGAGYSTPPTLSVPDIKGATARVEISFGKDMETNGAVSAITASQDK